MKVDDCSDRSRESAVMNLHHLAEDNLIPDNMIKRVVMELIKTFDSNEDVTTHAVMAIRSMIPDPEIIHYAMPSDMVPFVMEKMDDSNSWILREALLVVANIASHDIPSDMVLSVMRKLMRKVGSDGGYHIYDAFSAMVNIISFHRT